VGILAIAAVVAGVAWYLPRLGDDGGGGGAAGPKGPTDDPARLAAEAFADAWHRGALATVPVTPESGDVAGKVAFLTAELTSAPTDLPTKVEVTAVDRPPAGATKETATATASVTWTLDGNRTWTYDTKIPLVREAPVGGGEPAWRVAFTPAVVQPTLADGELLRAVRTPGQRSRIVDAAGAPLAPDKGAVVVGIRKSRATDVAATVRTAAELTGVDAAQVQVRVDAAGPDDFVEVATMARPDYERIRARIQPIPGTVFRELPGASTDLPASFARGLLGTTGAATPEIVQESKGRVQLGELTGLTGLQHDLDAQLAGTPGLDVQAVAATGGAPRRLQSFPGVPGHDVALTIDRRIQLAADAATAVTGKASALVAIRVSTGDIVAVANGPASASGFNRAMLGRYPPGSTFKVATALGLLERGVTPDTRINCPATIVIGKRFKNAGGEVLGNVTFRTDFAHSCNTAFVGQARTLSSKDLVEVAQRLGYRELDLGVPAFGGSVPLAEDLSAEHGADMIGQGKVEASPLAVALVSASVAAGRSVNPRLIFDPAKPAPVLGPELPAGPIESLRSLMREVVVSGTARVMRGVPGGDVHGKTGTAEFGNESPPHTHAWFTGYQGDIAFAVLVQDGGFGGEVAAPVAARFLRTLAGG
jgi:cell division protein FtsI/penicillin-binding protein 2